MARSPRLKASVVSLGVKGNGAIIEEGTARPPVAGFDGLANSFVTWTQHLAGY